MNGTVGLRARKLLQPLVAVGVLASLLCAAAASAGGGVPTARRAGPAVTGGSVSPANGTLKGWFAVRNRQRSVTKKGFAVVVGSAGGAPVMLGRYSFKALKPGRSQRVRFTTSVPTQLSGKTSLVYACVLAGRRYRANRVANCRALGRPRLGNTAPAPTTPSPTTPAPTTPAPTTPAPTTPAPTPPPCAPAAPPATSASSVPTDPVAFTPDQPFRATTSSTTSAAAPCADYWVSVPQSYAADHQTPMRLFVWMHGCGGDAEGDIYSITPNANRDYLAISLSGESGGGQCWDTAAGDETDVNKVLNAITDVRRHFNVDSRRIFIGGYSSGGDLAYRTIFYNANQFAGVLAMNTDPFRDTGSTQAQSLAAAAWKFNVYHLAHDQDDTYPFTTVQPDVQALVDAGFNVVFEHVAGDHWDDPNAGGPDYPGCNGVCPGTTADLQTYLLPHIDDAWVAPAT